jgi:hypothetical protein
MTSILIENAKHILSDGRCPSCFGRVKIREEDGEVFKNRIYKKFDSGEHVMKCMNTKCKTYLIEV